MAMSTFPRSVARPAFGSPTRASLTVFALTTAGRLTMAAFELSGPIILSFITSLHSPCHL